jgi:transposase
MTSIQNIAQAMDGKQIQVLNKTNQKTVDHYMSMFGEMTLENVEEIRAKHTQAE